jgi:hypothetical protein
VGWGGVGWGGVPKVMNKWLPKGMKTLVAQGYEILWASHLPHGMNTRYENFGAKQNHVNGTLEKTYKIERP